MTIPLFEPRASHPQDRAAWLASVAVHAGLFAALAYLSWSTFGRGSSHAPTSEGNIVVGLADGGDDDAPVGAATPEFDDSTTPGEGRPADLSGGVGDDLAAEDARLAASLPRDAAEPVVPAPRLPRLAVGGGAAASRPPGSIARRGALRFGQLADRATVTVFGAVGEGSKFVYLFDHSTSMTGAPLAAAKQQLIGSLDDLDSVHQFQIIFFNHEVQSWDLTGGQRRIPFATDANKQLAAQFVRSIAATGGTDRLAPLRRALAMAPDVVFFLTDADDAMPDYDVAEVVERARSRGTAIACIEFGNGPQPDGGNFLTQIAAATGGDYVYIDAAQLDDFLNR